MINILIIHKDCQLIKDILVKKIYEVEIYIAPTKSDAIKILQNINIDMILVNINITTMEDAQQLGQIQDCNPDALLVPLDREQYNIVSSMNLITSIKHQLKTIQLNKAIVHDIEDYYKGLYAVSAHYDLRLDLEGALQFLWYCMLVTNQRTFSSLNFERIIKVIPIIIEGNITNKIILARSNKFLFVEIYGENLNINDIIVKLSKSITGKYFKYIKIYINDEKTKVIIIDSIKEESISKVSKKINLVNETILVEEPNIKTEDKKVSAIEFEKNLKQDKYFDINSFNDNLFLLEEVIEQFELEYYDSSVSMETLIELLRIYKNFLLLFTEFDDLCMAFDDFYILLENMDFNNLNVDEGELNFYLKYFLEDINNWLDNNFKAKDADDINFLDKSIISNIDMISNLLKPKPAITIAHNEEEREDELEFF